MAGVNFDDTVLTSTQLDSTASYLAQDLHGIQLAGMNLTPGTSPDRT